MNGKLQPESVEREGLPRATELADKAVRAVEDALNLPHPTPADEVLLRDVVGLRELLEEIAALREFSLAMSKGELDYTTRCRGVVIGALKSLQANLRHLTWQTQRIAAGDLDVRVNFLGQFSDAFNSMTDQLKVTLKEKDKLAARYKDLSEHDPLTGLYNRAAFLAAAECLLSGDICKEHCSSLIMGDIDYFKRINDKFGHQCGDEVLRRVSRLYQDGLRQGDIICRYGGEEFLIFTPGTSVCIANRIAQRLCDAVRGLRIVWYGKPVPVTVSFGVCSLPPVGEEGVTQRFLREYIQIADLNLYQAKHAGRDRVMCTECDEEEGAG